MLATPTDSMRSPFSLLRVICLSVIMALVAASTTGHATTVIAPDFDGLVTRADAVFTGDVLGVRSEWTGEGANRRIVSSVTFDVLRVMKGEAATPYTLQMLGGTVGTRTMEVADAPKFATGDRVIVFVKDNGKQFFPAVGIMHGVYRLVRFGATAASPEMVIDHTGRRVVSVEELGMDASARETMRRAAIDSGNAAAVAGLTREQFENKIVERVQSLGLH